MTNQEKSNEQLEAELLGKKLGIFIAAMPADDEIKQSILATALTMTQSELVEFVTALEVQYALFETQGIRDEFEKGLNAIKEKFAVKRAALNKETLAAMADLEKDLDNL